MKRWQKVLLGVVLALVLVGGSLVSLPRLLWADRADYSKVVSIEKAEAYQRPELLEKAWALPVAALYRKGLDFQGNKSFCGPTSIVNVLRSLGLPGDQTTVLEGSSLSTIFGMLPRGITLDQIAELARVKTGKKVSILRGLDKASFREHLRQSNDPARRYVANFSRGPLFARGGGHHSPIAGYLAEEDLAFVLDVNQDFKPWLVNPDRLLEAMDSVDRTGKQKRGMIVIE